MPNRLKNPFPSMLILELIYVVKCAPIEEIGNDKVYAHVSLGTILLL